MVGLINFPVTVHCANLRSRRDREGIERGSRRGRCRRQAGATHIAYAYAVGHIKIVFGWPEMSRIEASSRMSSQRAFCLLTRSRRRARRVADGGIEASRSQARN